MRKQILNLRSKEDRSPRFCDVVVEGDKVTLEVKQKNDKVETIEWEDLVYQVNIAKEIAASK